MGRTSGPHVDVDGRFDRPDRPSGDRSPAFDAAGTRAECDAAPLFAGSLDVRAAFDRRDSPAAWRFRHTTGGEWHTGAATRRQPRLDGAGRRAGDRSSSPDCAAGGRYAAAGCATRDDFRRRSGGACAAGRFAGCALGGRGESTVCARGRARSSTIADRAPRESRGPSETGTADGSPASAVHCRSGIEGADRRA